MAIQLAGLHGNTVQLPVEAYSPDDLTRRAALKSEYDPDNLFRHQRASRPDRPDRPVRTLSLNAGALRGPPAVGSPTVAARRALVCALVAVAFAAQHHPCHHWSRA
jgi:hypothetical protein